MSRRRNSDEIEFGSDSFLDIVANIVGILIILIVVAGIKAGAAPVSAEHLAEYLRTHVKAEQAKAEQGRRPPASRGARSTRAARDSTLARAHSAGRRPEGPDRRARYPGAI